MHKNPLSTVKASSRHYKIMQNMWNHSHWWSLSKLAYSFTGGERKKERNTTPHTHAHSDIQHKIQAQKCHKKTHSNSNLGARKLVLDSTTALTLTNVDLLVWKVLGFNVENVITQG
jgi:hypothetical protein